MVMPIYLWEYSLLLDKTVQKGQYNFYEILIVLCFVIGIGMLIYSVFGLLEAITHLRVLQIGGIIAFIYISWAIGSFFDKKKKKNYLKALFAYILGMISFYVLVVLIGTLIDKI
jgi:predicted tellurium resistance membrane protein TerC